MGWFYKLGQSNAQVHFQFRCWSSDTSQALVAVDVGETALAGRQVIELFTPTFVRFIVVGLHLSFPVLLNRFRGPEMWRFDSNRHCFLSEAAATPIPSSTLAHRFAWPALMLTVTRCCKCCCILHLSTAPMDSAIIDIYCFIRRWHYDGRRNLPSIGSLASWY